MSICTQYIRIIPIPYHYIIYYNIYLQIVIKLSRKIYNKHLTSVDRYIIIPSEGYKARHHTTYLRKENQP